jgi:sec-independent protein translocase protein TatA
MNEVIAMWMPGWPEMIVIAIVGLLVFGRRLPEVGRSLGKSIVEFKRGVREAKNQLDQDVLMNDSPPTRLPPNAATPPKSAEKPVESTPVSSPAEKAGASSATDADARRQFLEDG